MSENKLTKQEMFDRAYRGLASQNWRPSMNNDGCRYTCSNARHCAWGWVDTNIPAKWEGCTVRDLRDGQVGLASALTEEDLAFAMDLQYTHDSSRSEDMQSKFVALAFKHNLTIPELP